MWTPTFLCHAHFAGHPHTMTHMPNTEHCMTVLRNRACVCELTTVVNTKQTLPPTLKYIEWRRVKAGTDGKVLPVLIT